jgi:hypothetical protein
MTDRGVHPDLLEEVIAEREAQAPPQEVHTAEGGRRTRAARRSAPPSASPPSEPTSGEPEADGEAPTSSSPAEGVSPDQGDDGSSAEWFAAVREAASPAEAFRLLAKGIPLEEIEKDEVFSGKIGALVNRRLVERERQQQRDALERQKREAAANQDYYTLGEISARDYQQELQAQQAAQQSAPFMEQVANFQRGLPEHVQKRVSGQQFDSVEHYLKVLTDEAVRLGMEQELQKRESALRKSVLSEVNGDEPVPERENGTPNRVREVTDEMIRDMPLGEYEALFDEYGRPRQGVRHRSTRGIPIRNR